MADIDGKKEEIIAKIKEAETKYYKESPCLHCGPGNGCDDCRGCEDAKKNHELEIMLDKARKEFHDNFGITYAQYCAYNQIIKTEDAYNTEVDKCRQCGGNFDDDCRDCADFDNKFSLLNKLKFQKAEYKKTYNIDFDWERSQKARIQKDDENFNELIGNPQELKNDIKNAVDEYIKENTSDGSTAIIKSIDEKIYDKMSEFDKNHKEVTRVEKLRSVVPQISELIYKKFDKKKDRGGNNYIEHLETVALNAEESMDWDNRSQEDSISAYIVGLCHDLFEDTDCTEEEFRNILDDDKIINAIKLCTRLPFETYREFIKRIKMSGNPIAIYVKIADLEHNMDMKRLKNCTDRDMKRLQKYFYSWQYLNGTIVLEAYLTFVHE